MNNIEVLKPLYFKSQVNFFRDFLAPFSSLLLGELKKHIPSCMMFLNGDAFGHKDFYLKDEHYDKTAYVNATHWYDGATLFTRQFNEHMSINTDKKLPVFGRSRIYRMHRDKLKEIIELPRKDLDSLELRELPTLIGEFGIPYDMNGGTVCFSWFIFFK